MNNKAADYREGLCVGQLAMIEHVTSMLCYMTNKDIIESLKSTKERLILNNQNNYTYQGDLEPKECGKCFSAMTENDGELTCDSGCVELTEVEQYEADAKADHVTEQTPNV